MKLLVVDDVATNRKLLRVTLEAAGHTTVEAADGVEALQVLARESVDAVISDILMPNMDGFCLCRQIRQSPQHHSLPFIIYTSTYTSSDDMKLGRAIGADKYLMKPAPAESLLQAVRDVLRERETNPISEAAPEDPSALQQYNQALANKVLEKNAELADAREALRLAHESARPGSEDAGRPASDRLSGAAPDTMSGLVDSNVTAVARSRLGSVLRGKYRLDRVLGVGGMAVVYAATHRNTKRFAVKMLHPEPSCHADVRSRFVREGYIANSVDHPGAVAVLDDDVAEDGSAFIVMELLQGAPVDEVWARCGPHMPLALVLSIGDAVLGVLEAAHAKGIVHRDIKPANLFLTTSGQLRVLDFGIARLRDATSGAATVTGALIGTPAFMPPEQAAGDAAKVDGRTDLWAVGATLFFLLTGEFVHSGENAWVLILSAATKPARDIESLPPDLPRGVALVVNRSLAFERRERWPDATAMRKALQQACFEATGEPIRSIPPGTVSTVDATLPSSPPGAPVVCDGEVPVPEAANRGERAPGGGSALSTQNLARERRGREVATQRRRTRLARAAFGVSAIAAGAVVAVVWLPRYGQFRAQSQGQGLALAVARAADKAVVVTELPIPPTAHVEAAAAYAAGLQSFRDGSPGRATDSMDSARRAAPSMAEAHLRAAIWGGLNGMNPRARVAFDRAGELRASLDDRDHGLFDAFAPYFAEPADLGAWRLALGALADSHPRDAELLFYRANAAAIGWEANASDGPWATVLAADPKFGMVASTRLEAFAFLGEIARAREAARECLRISPTSDTCLFLSAILDNETGACEAMVTHARALVGAHPSLSSGRLLLVRALATGGQSGDAPAAALLDALRVAPEAEQESMMLSTDGKLAVLTGDFASVERDELQLARFDSSKDVAQTRLVQLDDETARGAVALTAAEDLWKRHAADRYAVSEVQSYGGMHIPAALVAARLARAGRLSTAVLADLRSHWKERLTAGYPSIGSEVAWLYLEADPAETHDEAALALASLGHPVTLSPYAEWGVASLILGKLYFLAGRLDEATAPLEIAVGTCSGLEHGLEQTHAALMLGETSEAKGDVPGACRAYGVVLSRWGHAAKSVTAARARSRSKLLRCK